MIGALMLDVAGTTLTQEDKDLISNELVGGVILFARNVESPAQVRALTDSIREADSDILIAVDQEGGRVRRLRDGFSSIPPMGKIGKLFETDPIRALQLSEMCGWLMAVDVLSVGIDFSFAPVLDIDDVSEVIGDRGFHKDIHAVTALSQSFMHGMKLAGMGTTGKHFPGHGSCAPDSHVADAIDDRELEDIIKQDIQPFARNLHMLDALMPAHVIFPKVDDKPAGFSKYWIQEVIRKRLNFQGILFSDDLSMKAAHTAGGADARVKAAMEAGCDMALICNDRDSAKLGLTALENMPYPDQNKLKRMCGDMPAWQGSLDDTSRTKTHDQFGSWDDIRAEVAKLMD